MTREGIKEYLLQIKSKDGNETLADRWNPDILIEVIDQIYNNHEAQLEAKDEEIEVLHSHLKTIDEDYSALASDFESAVMEIDGLKDQLSSVHNIMYRNGYSDAIDCYDTFGNFNTRHKPNAKARSIVAMLFWEWRKAEARYKAEWSNKRDNRQLSLLSISSSKSELLFKQAYKMLKDTK